MLYVMLIIILALSNTCYGQTSAGCWQNIPDNLCDLDTEEQPTPLIPALWPNTRVFVKTNDCNYSEYMTDISYMSNIPGLTHFSMAYGGFESDYEMIIIFEPDPISPFTFEVNAITGQVASGQAEVYYITEQSNGRNWWRASGTRVHINWLGTFPNGTPLFPNIYDDAYHKVIRHELGHALLFGPHPMGVGYGDGLFAAPEAMTTGYGANELSAMQCAYGDWVYNFFTDDGDSIINYSGGHAYVRLPDCATSGFSRVAIEAYYASNWHEVGRVDNWNEGVVEIAVGFNHEKLRVVTYYNDKVTNKAGPVYPSEELYSQISTTVVNNQNLNVGQEKIWPEKTALIIGPANFINDPSLNAYVLSLEGLYNLNIICDIIPENSKRSDIRDLILSYFYGIDYVLLIGDANDYKCLNPQNEVFDELWVTDEDMCTYYNIISAPPYANGYPEWDIIPTWYIRQVRDRPCRYAEHSPPYTATDIPYVDFDDDGWPDIPIARIPAHSNTELQYFLNRSLLYHTRSDEQSVILLNQYYYGGGGEPSYYNVSDNIQETLNQMNDALNINANIFTIDQTEQVGNAWNRVIPEYYTLISTKGNSNEVGGLLTRYWADCPWPTTQIISHTALLTCYGAAYAHSKANAVCEKMLFDTNAGGAVSIVGPAGFTLYDTTKRFAVALSSKLQKRKFMIDIYYEALMEILQDDNIAEEIKWDARSYCLLGDPFSLLKNSPYNNGIVDVNSSTENYFIEAWPNPSNASTTFEIHSSVSGILDLYIYDVRGRIVFSMDKVTFNNEEVHINWNGKGNDNKSVPSGSYYAKIYINNKEVGTSRIIVVK